jgi:hypothetical protein
MMRRVRLVALIVAVSLIPAAGLSQSRATRDSMTGVWCGSARIVVDWAIEKNLGVRLEIPPSGVVTGQVGDARLVAGRLEANRGPVGRMLNIKTDYIIVGKLEGPIIASEGITRPGVKMPLNWTGSEFRGSVQSEGWKFGGKDRMVLTASHLVLRRWIVPGTRSPVPGACRPQTTRESKGFPYNDPKHRLTLKVRPESYSQA